jgi:hypothetical protein
MTTTPTTQQPKITMSAGSVARLLEVLDYRSTIPVSSFGPRPPDSTGLVLMWCQTCSSTPRLVTPSKRAGSAAILLERRFDRPPSGLARIFFT